MFKKLFSLLLSISFVFSSLMPLPKAEATEGVLGLPMPGSMVNLSPAYEGVMIKGLTVHADNPFLFDFIVDTGTDKLQGEALNQEGEKLAKYFLASLTIPEKDVWVNLSPYEKDRTIPKSLGQTDMGRDLLAQDYILKQLTASLIYPEKDLGREFWQRVYAKAQQLYGTSEIPVNTFNKVWITADRAEVFERGQTAFVLDRHLKVMLEEDYLALNKNMSSPKALVGDPDKTHSLASQIVRDIILPELEKEVNTGKNFAPLRQIFNAIILASWYKNNLKNALLNQVYADHATVKGIDLSDPTVKTKIYAQYLSAYKKGVFNYIKEESSVSSPNASVGDLIPRKYFSGGVIPAMATAPTVNRHPTQAQLSQAMTKSGDFATIAWGASTKPVVASAAMSIEEARQEIATRGHGLVNLTNLDFLIGKFFDAGINEKQRRVRMMPIMIMQARGIEGLKDDRILSLKVTDVWDIPDGRIAIYQQNTNDAEVLIVNGEEFIVLIAAMLQKENAGVSISIIETAINRVKDALKVQFPEIVKVQPAVPVPVLVSVPLPLTSLVLKPERIFNQVFDVPAGDTAYSGFDLANKLPLVVTKIQEGIGLKIDVIRVQFLDEGAPQEFKSLEDLSAGVQGKRIDPKYGASIDFDGGVVVTITRTNVLEKDDIRISINDAVDKLPNPIEILDKISTSLTNAAMMGAIEIRDGEIQIIMKENVLKYSDIPVNRVHVLRMINELEGIVNVESGSVFEVLIPQGISAQLKIGLLTALADTLGFECIYDRSNNIGGIYHFKKKEGGDFVVGGDVTAGDIEATFDLMRQIISAPKEIVHQGYRAWELMDMRGNTFAIDETGFVFSHRVNGEEQLLEGEQGQGMGDPFMLGWTGRARKVITVQDPDGTIRSADLSKNDFVREWKENYLTHGLGGRHPAKLKGSKHVKWEKSIRWNGSGYDIALSLDTSTSDPQNEQLNNEVFGPRKITVVKSLSEGKIKTSEKVENKGKNILYGNDASHPFNILANRDDWTLKTSAKKFWKVDPNTGIPLPEAPRGLSELNKGNFEEGVDLKGISLELALTGFDTESGEAFVEFFNRKTGASVKHVFDPKQKPNVMVWVPPAGADNGRLTNVVSVQITGAVSGALAMLEDARSQGRVVPDTGLYVIQPGESLETSYSKEIRGSIVEPTEKFIKARLGQEPLDRSISIPPVLADSNEYLGKAYDVQEIISKERLKGNICIKGGSGYYVLTPEMFRQLMREMYDIDPKRVIDFLSGIMGESVGRVDELKELIADGKFLLHKHLNTIAGLKVEKHVSGTRIFLPETIDKAFEGKKIDKIFLGRLTGEELSQEQARQMIGQGKNKGARLFEFQYGPNEPVNMVLVSEEENASHVAAAKVREIIKNKSAEGKVDIKVIDWHKEGLPVKPWWAEEVSFQQDGNTFVKDLKGLGNIIERNKVKSLLIMNRDGNLRLSAEFSLTPLTGSGHLFIYSDGSALLVLADAAMIEIDQSNRVGPTGGIDLKDTAANTAVRKEGAGVEFKFDLSMVARIRKEGLQSLTPVIINITPITNIWPILGLEPPKKEDERLAGV